MDTEFEAFPKIARLSREIIITEKIDGTNAQVFVYLDEHLKPQIKAGSRSRYITPEDDNYGFAKWVEKNKEELIAGLGDGRHYGEWWGSGCQRGYNLPKGEKRFSLFNVARWSEDMVRPSCCHVVPTLYRGEFTNGAIDIVLGKLRREGSFASTGFMDPEGVIIYHTSSQQLFKKTLDKDEEPKSAIGRKFY